MASTTTRRPLPALIALLALLLLTALVWWRVTTRDSGNDAAKASPRTSACSSASGSAVATPTVLPARKTVDVQVLNATTRSGLAGRVRDSLLQDGFRSTLKAGNDPQPSRVSGTAQIRFSAAQRPGALLVHYYFPDAQLVAQSGTSAQVVVSLGPKYAGIVSQQQVTAKLTADHVRVSTGTVAASTAPATPSGSPSC